MLDLSLSESFSERVDHLDFNFELLVRLMSTTKGFLCITSAGGVDEAAQMVGSSIFPVDWAAKGPNPTCLIGPLSCEPI